VWFFDDLCVCDDERVYGFLMIVCVCVCDKKCGFLMIVLCCVMHAHHHTNIARLH